MAAGGEIAEKPIPGKGSKPTVGGSETETDVTAKCQNKEKAQRCGYGYCCDFQTCRIHGASFLCVTDYNGP